MLFEKGDLLNTPIECFYYDSLKDIFPVKPHWHYYMEIIYMLSGNAEMNKDNEVYYISKGEMILFHPQAVHSIFSADGKPLQYAVFKLDVSRINTSVNYSPKLRSIFSYANLNNMPIYFNCEQNEQIGTEKIFKRCINEMISKRYGFDLVTRSEIYRLLIGIIRCWQESGFIIGSEAFDEDRRRDIYNITEYIDENLNSSLKVTDIAHICKMSYSYFAKKFPVVYGKSCKEYIEDMRIQKAAEFLVFTDFDLTYISQETGFSDCSHLIKSFKRIFEITPKQYRKLHKKA